MPTETRQILFEQDEVIEVLCFYSKATAGRIPPGDIEGCTLSKGDRVEATLYVRDLDGQGQSLVRFSTAELAAALITYCRDARIPVPKRSDKSIRVVDNRLTLSIRFDADAPAATQRAAIG